MDTSLIRALSAVPRVSTIERFHCTCMHMMCHCKLWGLMILSSVAVAPITITRQPMNQTVNRNGDASFTVEATGGGLTYQWLRDDMNLNDTDTGLEGSTTSTLRVLNAQNDDEGDYTCVITNSAGDTDTTAVARLTVGMYSVTFVCQYYSLSLSLSRHIHVLLLYIYICMYVLSMWVFKLIFRFRPKYQGCIQKGCTLRSQITIMEYSSNVIERCFIQRGRLDTPQALYTCTYLHVHPYVQRVHFCPYSG